MATIKLKRGSGVPSGLAAGEPAMDTATGRVYISKDGSSVVEVGSTALDSNVSNNLTVGNDATVSGDVLVSGTATLGNVSITTNSGNLTVGGTIIATGDVGGSNLNVNNWDAAYNSRPTGLSFSTSNGILTLQKGTGTETVDLDGRYFTGEIYEGTFTPIVKDNSGNTASIDPSSFGSYRKISTAFSDFIYILIQVGNINKSSMVGTDSVRIELPSYLPYISPVSAESLVAHSYRDVVKPNNNDNIVGYPDNASSSSQKVFRLKFRGGSTTPRDITFNDLNSNSGTLVITGWLL